MQDHQKSKTNHQKLNLLQMNKYTCVDLLQCLESLGMTSDTTTPSKIEAGSAPTEAPGQEPEYDQSFVIVGDGISQGRAHARGACTLQEL